MGQNMTRVFPVFSSRNQSSHPVTIHTLSSPCNKALLEETCMDCMWAHTPVDCRLCNAHKWNSFWFTFLPSTCTCVSAHSGCRFCCLLGKTVAAQVTGCWLQKSKVHTIKCHMQLRGKIKYICMWRRMSKHSEEPWLARNLHHQLLHSSLADLFLLVSSSVEGWVGSLGLIGEKTRKQVLIQTQD